MVMKKTTSYKKVNKKNETSNTRTVIANNACFRRGNPLVDSHDFNSAKDSNGVPYYIGWNKATFQNLLRSITSFNTIEDFYMCDDEWDHMPVDYRRIVFDGLIRYRFYCIMGDFRDLMNNTNNSLTIFSETDFLYGSPAEIVSAYPTIDNIIKKIPYKAYENNSIYQLELLYFEKLVLTIEMVLLQNSILF